MAATRGRTTCSEASLENAEPLAATASRVDHWLLVEYRALWAREALGGSALADVVKEHLRAQLRELPHAKLLFVRRPERRERRGLAVFFARTRERDRLLVRLDLERHEQLLDLDFTSRVPPGEPCPHPLLAVCTHGKHDRCCAVHGRPLYEALREQLDPDWVWQASHVGGDRFAGNLVCVREGLYFGRVAPSDVFPLLDEYLAGRVHLDRYRGRSCYTFAVQAAELSVRGSGDHRAIDDLELLGVARADGGWRVRFGTPAGETERRVELREGPLAYLTCHSESLVRPRRYVAV